NRRLSHSMNGPKSNPAPARTLAKPKVPTKTQMTVATANHINCQAPTLDRVTIHDMLNHAHTTTAAPSRAALTAHARTCRPFELDVDHNIAWNQATRTAANRLGPTTGQPRSNSAFSASAMMAN